MGLRELNPKHAVSTDDFHGGYLAAEYLIKQGKRRIAFLSFLGQTGPGAERLRGFRQAHVDYHLEVDEALVCFNQRLNEDVSGYDGMKQILATDDPDAVFCTSDLRALGAIRAIQESGLILKKDVAVVGYDDIFYAKGGNFLLTTIRQPFSQMTLQIIKIFNELRQGRAVSKRIHLFEGELIVRQST